MRHRLPLFSTVVVLALSLAIGIEAALAGTAVPQQVGPPRPPVPPGLIAVANANDGWGAGTVSSVPPGIDCGTSCAHQYPVGISVTLTATPAAGSTFGGWSGACTGTATCTVTAGKEPVGVTATFTAPRCVVPWVWGKALAAAKRSINSHDCAVGRIKHVASRTAKRGHVLSQRPAPDTQLMQRAKVNLVVSKGRR